MDHSQNTKQPKARIIIKKINKNPTSQTCWFSRIWKFECFNMLRICYFCEHLVQFEVFPLVRSFTLLQFQTRQLLSAVSCRHKPPKYQQISVFYLSHIVIVCLTVKRALFIPFLQCLRSSLSQDGGANLRPHYCFRRLGQNLNFGQFFSEGSPNFWPI